MHKNSMTKQVNSKLRVVDHGEVVAMERGPNAMLL